MPLIGLETINWEKLTHAYGSTEAIPDILRALDSAETNEAFYNLCHDLWGHINHQGDHYASTPVCVPFLFQILKNKHQTEQKLNVLTSLAELLRTLPRALSPSKTYQAIANELEYLLSLLVVEREELRLGSIYVLSFLEEQAERILPALLETIHNTKEEKIQACAVWTYGKLAKSLFHRTKEIDLSQLSQWFEDESYPLFLRYGAAFGYISLDLPIVVPSTVKKLVLDALNQRDSMFEHHPDKNLDYIYSEIMLLPDNTEELRKLAEGNP